MNEIMVRRLGIRQYKSRNLDKQESGYEFGRPLGTMDLSTDVVSLHLPRPSPVIYEDRKIGFGSLYVRQRTDHRSAIRKT